MKITLLCTSAVHPVNEWLLKWIEKNQGNHDIALCRDRSDLAGGDVLFLISCSQIIDADTRSKYTHTLVIHASDLPKGRGWSPHVWELLGGAKRITVSVLEAEDEVDTGAIWLKHDFSVPEHALYDEINESLFEVELTLIDEVLLMIKRGAKPVRQPIDISPTYWPKRSPADSELDPSLSLQQLFSTIRVMDPDRFPAFFRMYGHVYKIQLKKVEPDDEY